MMVLTTGFSHAQTAEEFGTVQYALDRADGTRVSLTMVVVGAVNSSGVSVHEWWDKTTPIAAIFDPPPSLRAGQTIDLEGWMTTLPNGRRAVLAERIAFYLDSRGSVTSALPPMKGILDPSVWPAKGWIPVYPLRSGIQSLSTDGGRTVLTEEIEPPIGGDPPTPPTVTFTPGTIPYAKSLADNESVTLAGKIVTAATGQLGPFIYIQEPDHSAGIRVNTSGLFTVGEVIQVSGAVTTSTDGERLIQATSIGSLGSVPPLRPSGMTNRDLGGGDFAYDSGAGTGQQGVYNAWLLQEAMGLSNIGVLVKTWGTVTQIDPSGDYFYICDGSALADGTMTGQDDNIGVRVTDPSGAPAPSAGNKVEIIGISSCTVQNGHVVRLLRAQSVRNLSVASTVLHVKPGGAGNQDGSSWDNAMASVQTAINAEPACEIWVAAGTYTGCITLKAGRKLYGGFAGTEITRWQRNAPSNTTVLDGGGAGSVVTCESGATSATVIDGFTIRNGSGTFLYHQYYGAGILCESTSSPTISNNVITGNTVEGYGGGIYCSSSSPVITGNTITNNSATYGDGGGIYCSQSTATITGNTVSGNTASHGAGIYVYSSSGSGPTAAGNIITGNTATTSGGGLSCVSRAVITNNTIVSNTGGSGGGIYCSSSTTWLKLTNNIVAFNNSGICNNSGTPALSNNCVYGNTAYQYSGLSAGAGDISADPAFVDRADDNLHIQPNSPCVDAGLNTATGLPTTDMDSQPRVQNETVDIGADESGGCEWYSVTLTTDPLYSPVGGSVNLTVNVTDRNQQAIEGVTVCATTTDGTIIAINEDQFSPGVSSGCGLTDPNGNVTLAITRATIGPVTVTARVGNSCQVGETEESVDLWFYDPEEDWPMFQHDIAHTGATGCPLPANLQKKWVKPLAGTAGTPYDILWSSPVVADGVVYVGTDAGILYAFDAQTGDPIAERNLNSPIHGTPCVADGRVYVGTYNGTLHVLSAPGLGVEWTVSFPGDSITGGVTVFSGAAYFGTEAMKLHTLDLLSHTDRSGSPASIPSAVRYTTPAIDESFQGGARCYISDASCYITAARCDTGAWRWEWYEDSTPMYASPVIHNGQVFVGSDFNRVYALVDTGESAPDANHVWWLSTAGSVRSTPAASNGRLYFGCSSYAVSMYCLDLSTRNAAWTAAFGNPAASVSASPLLSIPSKLLFVATDDGNLYAVQTANGSSSLVYDTSQDIASPSIKSSPAAADGCLFIVAGNASGRYLYCFGP